MEKSYLEKLTVPQRAKTLASFGGTRRFITVFTTARHLSHINPLHALPSLSLTPILILSSNLSPGLSGRLFFLFRTLYIPHAPPISFSMIWAHK